MYEYFFSGMAMLDQVMFDHHIQKLYLYILSFSLYLIVFEGTVLYCIFTTGHFFANYHLFPSLKFELLW